MASNVLIFLLAMASTSVTESAPTPADSSCGQPADVIFAIDTSNSIWVKHFKDYVLPFVNNVSSIFNVGPNPYQIRVGAATYSTEVKKQFELKDHQNKDDLKAAIDKIYMTRGETYTDRAINTIVDEMFTPEMGAREGIPHIIVVLTDGASTKRRKTYLAAQRAKQLGVTIFAIGVGRASNRELVLMASEPASTYKFKASKFSDLDQVMVTLALKACEVRIPTTTVPPTTTTTTTTTTEDPMNDCGGKPADIFFVVDSSSSIWTEDFDLRVLGFLRSVISGFSIGPDKTRFGVMTFSDDPRLVIGLDDYNNKRELIQAVNPRVVKYTLGGTNTAGALEDVRKYGFHKNLNRGRDVTRIAIVITDGASDNEQETKAQAELLKEMGVMVYAIGVGNGVDQEELETIANSPMEQFVFSVDDFSALSQLKDVLSTETCGGKQEQMAKTQPRCGNNPIEMTFAFDGSTVGNSIKEQVVKNVQFMTKRLTSLESEVKIGVSSGPCPHSLDVQLSDPNVASLKMKRKMRHIKPQLHSIVKSWRHEQKLREAKHSLKTALKIKEKYPDEKIEDKNVSAKSRALVVLINRENMPEFDYILEEVALLLKQGVNVFAVLDESVGKFHVSEWEALLGPGRVLGGVTSDYDYSGHMMEFMCSL